MQDVTQPDVKSITVPISTFPPTAMVYNVTKPAVEKHSDDDSDDNKPPVDIVSAAIMAKVLEDREKERIFAKHCDTCTCHRSILVVDAETQTCMPEVLFFNEHTRNVDKQVSDSVLNGEKHQSKEKLNQPNLATHTVFYEINENGDKIHHHVNGDCAKYSSSAPCIKDKFIGRCSRNEQDCTTEENCATTKICSNKNSAQNHESKFSPSFPKLNNLNRINFDRTFKLRNNSNKKCDCLAGGKSAARHSNKSERSLIPALKLVDHESMRVDKEQTHIDIINDRLWKNEWTKSRSEMSEKILRENKGGKTNRGIELDIINDRDWKNGRRERSTERREARNTAQFTLIEVKSPDNSAVNHNDGSQMEVATSPSFSSDSMIISSSDPSSSCSDVTQSLTGGAFNLNAKSNSSQGRVSGPRNCLVRVTPGSKNILLDNAGHYKTVLYSSNGSGKTNTALVHAKKASRAGSERSTSTSSEDNSPSVLLQDNQLQRVAEWVQSSVKMCAEDDSVSRDSIKSKCTENVASNGLPSAYDSLTKVCNSLEQESGSAYDAPKNIEGFIIEDVPPSNINTLSKCMEQDESENLITFDVLDEERPKDSRKKDVDYEVKITKEMEETYLKLAASLDPVTLSLSSVSDAELTIEKYRKDHKRLHVQRVQDREGSKA